MTDRRVALLRGINVGTAKRIAMADLRTLFDDLGHRDVVTLLNSGNVVFTVVRKGAVDEAARIEKAIVDRLGVRTRVTILTARALSAALDANPLKTIARDPSRMLLMALSDRQASARLKPLLGQRWAPEAIALGTRVAYLWCANGIAKGRLWTEANRAVGDGGTARNLSTMTKLLALASKP